MFRGQADTTVLWMALVVFLPAVAEPGFAGAGDEPAAAFQSIDQDNDGTLRLEEYQAFNRAGPADVAARDFKVLDFDVDDRLSRDEFQASRRFGSPGEARGSVPDPMANLARREIERWKLIFAQADSNRDGRLTTTEWPTADLAREFAVVGDAPFSNWDGNSDGAVEPSEGESWFKVAYGLIRADGESLRDRHGTVINWSYIRGLDRDRDGTLSRDEFVSQFWAGKERSPVIFDQIDANRDEVATFRELAASPSFSIDTLQAFLRADTDLDGALGTDELSASANRWQKGLALRLVAAFDEDGDGRLSFSEYRMTPFANPGSDWNRRRNDSDLDGQLSWSEFYLEASPSMIGQNWFVFSRLDRNRDNLLSTDEFDFEVDRSMAPRGATVDAAFQRLDRDKDARLDLKELFSAGPPPETNEKATRKYRKLYQYHADWFRIADRDRDEHLSAAEFANAPSPFQPFAFATLMERDLDGEIGTTLDPVTDWMEQRLAAVLQVFHAQELDREGQLPLSRWPRPLIAETVPELAGVVASEWDGNRDGRVSEDECRFILEIAFGVRLPAGQPLRFPPSLVVNWASISWFDENGDGALSKAEYTARHWAGMARARELFQTLDSNGDGAADFEELSSSPIFLSDSVKTFFKFDLDGNGSLNQSEIESGATKAQQRLSGHILPAFDANRDGRLSLYEFRSCPLASPLTDWHRLRTDVDNDGRLSWREFHLEKGPFLVGLSYRFFQLFDLNHDGLLASNEMEARVDFKALPLEVAFQIKDSNADGRLVLTEFFPDQRPADSDLVAIERFELRLAREEDRFLAGDVNRDQALDLTEFTQLLRNPRATLKPGSAGVASSAGSGRSLWIVPLIFVLHGVALVGVASYVLYRRPRRGSASNEANAPTTSGARR